MIKAAKLAVLAIAALSAFASAPANAATHMVEREYYSDATYTVQVGYSINTCQNQIRGWGYPTQFYIELGAEPCATPGAPTPPYP